MEENARILRVCVWFSPIQPPNAVEARAMAVSIVGSSDLDVIRRRVSGGNFIRVESRRAVIRGDPCRTSGNQKWNGTRPSLIAIAAVSSRHEVGWLSCVMSHWPVAQALVMLENRSRAEAAACVRKYFVAASTARGWWDLEIRGIMASVLISRPVQARTQWLLEIVIVVPSMRLRARIGVAWGFISRGGG